MRHGPAFLRRFGVSVALLAGAASSGPKIEDIVLHLSGTAQVEFRFAPVDGASSFPAFFQKADSANHSLLLSFLETESALPLQSFELPADAPLLAKVEIKRLRSPSGKLFLGVEFVLKNSPDPKSPWEAKPKGTGSLTFALGKAPKKTAYKSWSLVQSLTLPPPVEPATPAAPVVEATEPPKPEPVIAVPEPKAPEAVVAPPEPVVTPEPVAPPPAAVEAAPAAPQDTVVAKAEFKLLAIKVAATTTKEEISFVFQGKENPEFTVESARGITGTIIKFSPVRSDSISAKYDLEKNGWTRLIRLKKQDLSATFILVTDSALTPKVVEGKGKLTFVFPHRAGHPLYSWSSKNPALLPKPAAEPALSAHSDGRKQEGSKPAGLSSGKIFTLAGAGKSMIVVRDSVSLSAKPSKESSGRFLMAGETVRRLGTSGNFVRILSGNGDSGFVASSALAYADELSASKIRSIEAKVKARTEVAVAVPPTPPAPVESPKEPVAEPVTQPAVAEPAPAVEPAMPAEPTPAKAVAAEPAAPKKGSKSKKAETPQPPAEPSLSMPSQADESRLGLSPEALAAEKHTAEVEKMDLAPRNARVSYNSFSRRDPFIPLEQGGADQGIDIDQMKLVGIVKENDEPLAVLENIRDINISYTVRQGDAVHNGRVSHILPESITFDLTEFGISRSFTLKLVPSQERTGK